MDIIARQRRHVEGKKGMPQFWSHQLTEGLTEAPLSQEDYLQSRAVQKSIISQIDTIVRALTTTTEPDDDTQENNIDCIVAQPLISESLFDFLVNSNRLPEYQGNSRIKYELAAYRLIVSIIPSACHDYTANSFSRDLCRWTESGGVLDTLEIGGGAWTLPIYLSLTLLVFPWAVGSKKSPDNSFRPTQLQSPPGVRIGTSNVLYPNFTMEVATSNESWDHLLADADEKHFSPLTGIVMWLGIKIYPTVRMRVCLKERDMIQGFGALDPPLAITGSIDTTAPCQASIVLPKRLLYHGVPNAHIPPTLTPDYVLDLNIIRESIDKNFEA
jgi:hypothetical protein